MGDRLRMTQWLCRVTLFAFVFIFTSVSLRFLFHPVENGAVLGMVPSPSHPALGVISIRVGYGVYPIAFIMVGLFCLLTSRFREGLSFIAAMMILLLGGRIINGLFGGPLAENPFVLVGEVVLLVFSITGIFLESRLQRRLA